MYIVTYYNGIKPKVKKYKTRTGAMRNFRKFVDKSFIFSKHKLFMCKNHTIEVNVMTSDRIIKQFFIYIK